MSFQLIKQVWQLDLTPIEQHVLMAMADYADDDGRNCFPSQPRLAWKTKYHKSTIVRTIDKLISIGILQIVRPATNKAPAHYQICLENGIEKTPFVSDNGDSRGSTVLSQEDSRDSTQLPQHESRDSSQLPQEALRYQTATPGGSTQHRRGSTQLPDPIINQSINQPDNGSVPFPEKATEKTKANAPGRNPAPPLGAEANLAGMWLAYLQEQRKEHKTMTDWLQGSELIATGEQRNGRAHYLIWVADACHLDWLREQAAGLISRDLRVMLGVKVALEIVAELPVAV